MWVASTLAIVCLLGWLTSNFWFFGYRLSRTSYFSLSFGQVLYVVGDTWSPVWPPIRLPSFSPIWMPWVQFSAGGISTQGIALWIPFLISGTTAVFARFRFRQREQSNTCVHCGYALAGLPEATACPECGSGKTLESGRRQ